MQPQRTRSYTKQSGLSFPSCAFVPFVVKVPHFTSGWKI